MRARNWLAGAAMMMTAVGSASGQTAGMLGFQGFIRDTNGVPLTGTHDFEFRIYDAATGGNFVDMDGDGTPEDPGDDVTDVALMVMNGIVTTKFGPVSPVAFNGSQRWLEVTVDGTPLSRLELATAPATAEQVNVPQTGMSAISVDENGAVGIGTTHPLDDVHIARDGGNVLLLMEDTSAGGKTYHTGINSADGTFVIAETGVAERVVIQPGTGNVGIGTTSPAGSLHVKTDGPFPLWAETTDATARFVLEGDAFSVIRASGTGSTSKGLTIQASSSGADGAFVEVSGKDAPDCCGHGSGGVLISTAYDATEGDVVIRTQGADRMIVDQVGNVGIGTTEPANKLQIGDGFAHSDYALALRGPTSGGYGVVIDNDVSNQSPALRAISPTGELFRVQNNGNVGIGTTSPSYRLHVAADTPNTAVVVEQSNPAGDGVHIKPGSDSGYALQINNAANNTNRHIFSGDGSAKLALGGGNVGIGTASPVLDFKLTVQQDNGGLALRTATPGAVYSEVDFYDAGNARVGGIRGHTGSSSTPYDVELWSDAGDVVVTGGNVGIGTTSPGYKLEVRGLAGIGYGNANIVGSNNGDTVGLGVYSDSRKWDLVGIVSTATDYFAIRDSTIGTERLAITEAGNVGIGTTSPAYRLDVEGSARARDGIKVPIYRASTTLASWPVSSGSYVTIPGLSTTFSVSMSSTLDINSVATVIADDSDTQTFTRVFVDGVGATDAAGGPLESFDHEGIMTNVYVVDVGPGSHTVDIRIATLVDSGVVHSGFVRVVVYPQ